MKNKIFAIALSILMAACLTACKGTAPDSQPGSNSQSISSSASASSQNLELLYGRVSEVAGNELTLDLAKLPGEDEAASAPENRFHLSALSPSGSIRRAAKCDDASAAARLSHQQAAPLAVESLTAMGLGNRLRHRPNQLSGGQQQRVAIARALVGKPALLLADEPTGALDTRTGQEILELFRQLNRQGHTIIQITHDLTVASAASRILHLRDGVLTDQ